MKRSVFLILTAILSACASDIQSKNDVLAQPIVDSSPISYMSNQEKELRDALRGTSFKLMRYNNILVVSLSGNDLFHKDSSQFSTTVENTLQKIAPVLAHYDKTRISIIGFVNSGTPSADRKAAEKQAQGISELLKRHAKIAPVRFWVEGFNPEVPMQTEEDYIENNCVKIILTPTFIQ